MAYMPSSELDSLSGPSGSSYGQRFAMLLNSNNPASTFMQMKGHAAEKQANAADTDLEGGWHAIKNKLKGLGRGRLKQPAKSPMYDPTNPDSIHMNM